MVKGQKSARDGNSRLCIAQQTGATAIEIVDQIACQASREDLGERTKKMP
jgi:hypothetical protein